VRHPIILATALAALTLSAPTVAIDYTVDSMADAPDVSPADGVCRSATNECTLRAAIQQANATPGFDRVLIPEGSYLLDLEGGSGEDAGATGDLDIREPLALIGNAPTGSSVGVQISNRRFTFGAQYDRIFDIDTGNAQQSVRLEHMAINFGSTIAPLGGGGVLVHAGSAASMQDVVLYANFGTSRGTALALYGNAELRDCRAFDNHTFAPVTSGNVYGTIYVGGDGRLEADNLVIDSNNAELGGALMATDHAVVNLRRAAIYGNSADQRGGGAAEAGLGGGLFLAGQAQATLENVTLHDLFGFTADGDSNAVVVRDDAQLVLRHASVQAMSLQTRGNGAASIHVADSLLFGRFAQPQRCSGQVVSDGGNWFTSATSCALASTPSDHLVASLEANSVVLAKEVAGGAGFSGHGSPHSVLTPVDGSVLDQAGAASCPALDQLESQRPSPSAAGRPRACDAGAIELPLDHLFVDGME
jgi:CSLREA domain-containing protein